MEDGLREKGWINIYFDIYLLFIYFYHLFVILPQRWKRMALRRGGIGGSG